MAAYKYSYGAMKSLFKNPAEVAGPICEALRNSPQGLTPMSLLDASRDVNAPLHNEFEWDDTIAAEKYRKGQAKCLIEHLIRIEITDNERVRQAKDRAFVSTYENKNVYVPLDEALSNEVWKANLLQAARVDAERFIAKYHRLTELSNVVTEIKRFLDEEAS